MTSNSYVTENNHGNSAENKPLTTVYYDGSCPLCSREINWYKQRRGAAKVCWCDISVGDAEYVSDDLKTKDAMARLHVRKEDGSLVSGAVAFSELWLRIPSVAILGKFAQLPVISQLAEVLYKVFLYFRARR